MGIQFDFSGKNVLITGAERGIGLAIAKGFAKCGANIIIAGIMEEEFQNAKQEIENISVIRSSFTFFVRISYMLF